MAALIDAEAIVPRESSSAFRVEKEVERGFRRVIFVVVLKSKTLLTELRRDSRDTGREELFSVENCFSEGDGVGIPNV